MRILAATPTFFPILGGAELLVRDVLNALAVRDEVRLVTPFLPEWSRPFWTEDDTVPQCDFEVARFEERVSLLNLRGHKALRGAIPPISLTGLRVLARECRKFDADVLLSFFAVPYGLPAVLVGKLFGVRTVLVLCGTEIPSPRTADVPGWRYYNRLATRSADRVVYVSRFCFDALESRAFDPSHDIVIHGGIDESLGRGNGGRIREKLGVGPNDVVLFSLQRLGMEKRVDITLRAFALLDRSDRRYRLVIGGQGEDEPRLRRIANELGIADEVVFTGALGDEKADWYAACDMVVFHSVFETFGLVLAEAMTAGKPVVSVRSGAIPEVVDDGVSGLIVPASDPAAMAEAVESLLADPARLQAMGKAARARAERLFRWEDRVVQWREALTFDAELAPVSPVTRDAREGEG